MTAQDNEMVAAAAAVAKRTTITDRIGWRGFLKFLISLAIVCLLGAVYFKNFGDATQLKYTVVFLIGGLLGLTEILGRYTRLADGCDKIARSFDLRAGQCVRFGGGSLLADGACAGRGVKCRIPGAARWTGCHGFSAILRVQSQSRHGRGFDRSCHHSRHVAEVCGRSSRSWKGGRSGFWHRRSYSICAVVTGGCRSASALFRADAKSAS